MFRATLTFVITCALITGLVCSDTAFASPLIHGDTDTDGDVDNSDIATIVGNYGLGDAYLSDGDADGDGDVDWGDFMVAETDFSPSGDIGFNGVVISNPITAQLFYDTTTGEVFLDQTNAPGGAITAFVLQSNTAAFDAPGTAVFPYWGGLFEDVTSVISQSDPDAEPVWNGSTSGFSSNPHSMDAILPAGLDLAGLASQLSLAIYVGEPGTGVREFELVVVPEPTTCGLALAVTLFFTFSMWRSQGRFIHKFGV